MKNKHAQALVKLARGVPKRYSEEEIAKRTERLKGAREVKKLMSLVTKERVRKTVEQYESTHKAFEKALAKVAKPEFLDAFGKRVKPSGHTEPNPNWRTP